MKTLAAHLQPYSKWFIREVKKGIEEAECGDLATDDEIAAWFSRWEKIEKQCNADPTITKKAQLKK